MIFYGRNVSIEALLSEFTLQKLYLDSGINRDSQKVKRIIHLSKKNTTPISFVNRGVLNKLANTEEHQGVVIDINFSVGKIDSDFIESSYDNDSTRFIYITEAHHDHNIGAIIRSAEVSGAKGVIIPKDANISGAVGKSSTGAIFHIPVYSESIFNAIKKFSSSGYSIYGIEREGTPYYREDISGPSLFIIGGEDKSLSESVRNKCNNILEIPQKGKVNSLNMSVAASIILFEGLKQELEQ